MLLDLIHDCLEKLVISKFGLSAWKHVQKLAVPKHSTTTDGSTMELVAKTTSHVSGHSPEELLEALGEYIIHHLKDEGYEQWLESPGNSLRDWLGNLNGILQHLHLALHQMSKVNKDKNGGNKATSCKCMNMATGMGLTEMPRFYCEDAAEGDGSIIFHCYLVTSAIPPSSARNSTSGLMWWAAHMVKGMVSEVAGTQFGVEISMDRFREQGISEAECTSWRVAAMDPSEQWKLYRQNCIHPPNANEVHNKRTVASSSKKSAGKCAHTGMTTPTVDEGNSKGIGLSGTVIKDLFPYHAMIDSNFIIKQTGNQLPNALKVEDEMVGQNIANFFFIKGEGKKYWNWRQLCLQERHSFYLETNSNSSATAAVAKPVTFKTSVMHISDGGGTSGAGPTPLILLILNPEFNDLKDLGAKGWTLSDLPVHHSAQQELILARDYLQSLHERQKCMEELGVSLAKERNLLESLLPTHAAEGLRAGKLVEPMLHKVSHGNPVGHVLLSFMGFRVSLTIVGYLTFSSFPHQNVTFFFSDVVGFTDICRNLHPAQVIEMLNQLYSVCDFLATRMGIFKIETIGDGKSEF